MVLQEIHVDDEYTTIKEGATKLVVPKASLSSQVPPRKPVFFNPRGRNVRDLSILAYRAMKPQNAIYGEALAAGGARLVRVANEVKGIERVYGNDLNQEALRIAMISARMNQKEEMVELSSKNAELFLAEKAEKFDILDIDPFGSPAKYIPNGLRSVRFEGMLSVTATDTATLKGLYNQVAFRRYFGTSLRCDFSTEIGLRLLASMVVRVSLQLDISAKVAFVHSEQHYMRAYFIVEKGIERANEKIEGLGYIRYCNKCLFRKEVRLNAWDEAKVCPRCSSRTAIAGPLWVGSIFDGKLVYGMIKNAEEKWMKKRLSVLERAHRELPSPPYYFRIPDLADKLGKRAASPSAVVERLVANGYRASLTALDSQGVRTDAPVEAVEESLSRV